jgi:hypothetical protein
MLLVSHRVDSSATTSLKLWNLHARVGAHSSPGLKPWGFLVTYNKKRQREITAEMQGHVDGDESYLITAQTVLGLARRAREIYESSNMSEKQQLLNFVFSNLKLDCENLHVELRKPFDTIVNLHDQPEWLGRKDSNLRMPGPKPGALPLGDAPTRNFKKAASA